MANQVTIDIEVDLHDNASNDAKAASKSFDDLEKNAKKAAKEIDNLGKKKAQPKVDADTSPATKKVSKLDKMLAKLGRSKTETKISALDKATQIINKVTSKAKAFGNKTYSAVVKVRDSNVLSSLSKMSNGLKSLTNKTWTAAIKIKDTFTAPLTALKNMLFNIRTLILGIASAWAMTKLVSTPINVADQYSSAKISFSTLLGESQGQQMMDDLDAFAAATPFNTSNVIANAQKMLAMGWNPEDIIGDMQILGDAAAATGKLDQGLESIVRAMSQIKTKGKLSTEELNQLAEAGISAKAMLAEQLGYGTGDSGIAAMTEDLEDGKIASDAAIAALLAGMQKYNGMMESMANETVDGLKSQIQDAFEINIVRKWGQGLQDGAKRGLGNVISLLDEAETAMAEFGDTAYEIGKTLSNWAADKLENAIKRITDITGTYEFKNASLKEKISMLWNGVIVDPLKEWWEGGGQQKTAETAGKIGSWMGKTITAGLLAIFGMTDILDDETAAELGMSGGMSVAQSFAQGFKDNFDGSAITDAFVDAISNVWGALPWWAKMLIGGYGIGKLAGGISNFAGSITSFVGGASKFIGSATAGTGLLGFGANTAISLGAGNLAGGASLGAAGLSALGLAGTAGGIAGGASLIKGVSDLYKSNKYKKTGNEIESEAYKASGDMAIGGVAAGAAAGALIGSIVPVIGTALGALVGAGVGGVAGWITGDNMAGKIRAAKYESEEMQAAIKSSEVSAEELAETFKKAKWENATKHFGNIALSMSEIQRLADQIVWGDDISYYEDFSYAVKTAEANLQSLKTATQQTERWMWKASLGVKFNADERESIQNSIDEYISSAMSFVENKHYEFTAAVSLLVDVESEEGKSIIESGNAFYTSLQEQLNSIGTELSSKVNIALKDGVITLNEQAEIINLQQQIADITAKLADAEQKAELELIKLKFGSGNLDYESFETFMAQMNETIAERVEANDKAFVASVSSLNLQFAEGAISQEQYDTQLQALINGYNDSNAKLTADIKEVELNIIGDAYAQELGADAVDDLNKALNYAISNGIDPIEITDQSLSVLLNAENLSGETAANIREMLSGVAAQLGLIPVEADIELYTKLTEGAEEDVTSTIQFGIPELVEDKVPLNLTPEINALNALNETASLLEEFGIPTEYSSTVALLLTANAETLNKLDPAALAKDFGISESHASTIIQKLTAEESIENKLKILASDFGVPDSISKTISINLTAISGKMTSMVGGVYVSFGSASGKDQGYRGGIFGGDSAMDAFARGGETDNSGIVGGSTRFIRVNEESPEMIIPLSSQRRERALKLWTKTGEMLGVPGFARGGISSGGNDDGIRFMHSGSDGSAGSREINITFGDINFTIQASGNDKDSIVAAIKAQAGELADYIVGMIADELAGEFENTPVKGGAA